MKTLFKNILILSAIFLIAGGLFLLAWLDHLRGILPDLDAYFLALPRITTVFEGEGALTIDIRLETENGDLEELLPEVTRTLSSMQFSDLIGSGSVEHIQNTLKESLGAEHDVTGVFIWDMMTTRN